MIILYRYYPDVSILGLLSNPSPSSSKERGTQGGKVNKHIRTEINNEFFVNIYEVLICVV
jgi:hypothetical protein